VPRFIKARRGWVNADHVVEARKQETGWIALYNAAGETIGNTLGTGRSERRSGKRAARRKRAKPPEHQGAGQVAPPFFHRQPHAPEGRKMRSPHMNGTLDLRNAIRDEVLRCGGDATFVRFSRLKGFDGDHGFAFEGASFSNMVIWDGMSIEAIHAIRALEQSGECHLWPCKPLLYAFDGSALSYPVATQLRHYKSPRWLPCLLKAGPNPRAAAPLRWID
jgi:hypothetical protein